ncbi:MAG: hypothetical protein ACQESR_20220, partial [Planctomycetota bacterium]
SYILLPRESFPDVPIPYVLVTTVYEGVSPQDVETAVTMKIEQPKTRPGWRFSAHWISPISPPC